MGGCTDAVHRLGVAVRTTGLIRQPPRPVHGPAAVDADPQDLPNDGHHGVPGVLDTLDLLGKAGGGCDRTSQVSGCRGKGQVGSPIRQNLTQVLDIVLTP